MSEKSLWEQYKEKNKDMIEDIEKNKSVKPWDFLNPNTEYAEESVANDRLSICQSCPELISLTSQCKKCGCFMKLKTKLLNATCPLEKW